MRAVVQRVFEADAAQLLAGGRRDDRAFQLVALQHAFSQVFRHDQQDRLAVAALQNWIDLANQGLRM